MAWTILPFTLLFAFLVGPAKYRDQENGGECREKAGDYASVVNQESRRLNGINF